MFLLVKLREESIVDDELVRRLDFLRLRCSQQQALLQFSHRQRLERADQILLGYVGLLLDLLIRHPITSVEQHQDAHLEGQKLSLEPTCDGLDLT